ncbi:MAG: Hsp33 family molecular chaperone HslO, partial [Treponema sp.]|nr:Hsp33 family molecular chaperone HslO [Treponema sp.]
KVDAAAKRDALIQNAERAFGACPSLGQWFSEGQTREPLIKGLFREFDPKIVLERDVVFDCPCSTEAFADSIKHIGKAELEDILANDPDPIEVSCKNCGSVYKISKDMLRQ